MTGLKVIDGSPTAISKFLREKEERKVQIKEIYNIKLNIINTISNLEEKERVAKLLEMLEQKTQERIEFLQNEIIKLQKYETERVKKIRDDFIKIIDELGNPYPKDVFTWDNKEKLNFNRGRFNQHCFEIVENTKADIKKRMEEIKDEIR